MTKELGDHISTPSTVPEARGTSSHTHPHSERSECPPSRRSLNSIRGEHKHRCKAAGGERRAPRPPQRARGWGSCLRVLRSNRGTRGATAAGASPAGWAAAARARRRLAGSSRARPSPGAGGSAEGLRSLGPGRERGPRRGRRTRGAPPISHPPSRVLSPRPPPRSSLTLAPRLRSEAGSGGCSGGGSGLQTGSPGRQPAPQPPSLPPLARARGAGKIPPEPLASARAARTLPQLARAEQLERRPGAAAVPKALYRRADRAALPWLRPATAGEAGRRQARHGAGGSSSSRGRGSSAPRARSGRPGRSRSRLCAQLQRDQQ